MYLLNIIIVLYYSIPCFIAHNITILTDWNENTLQCMNTFFETTRYWAKYDTNIIISGLDEKEGNVIFFVLNRI